MARPSPPIAFPMRPPPHHAFALVFFYLSGVGASPEEAPRAESLFRSGRDAFQRGDYSTACPQLAESHRLEPAAGTVLALALCYEAWGKNATAWALFQEAEAMARVQGRTDRVTIARQRALALESGLSFLTILFEPGATSSVEVSLDGLRVAEAAVGVQTAVDVGAHRVEGHHGGKVYFDRIVHLAAKERLDVVVPAPPPLAEPTAARATPASTPQTAASSPNPPAAPLLDSEARASASEPTEVGRRTHPELGAPRRSEPTPYGAFERHFAPALLGVGLATLFTGGYFGVRAWQGAREVDRGCSNDPCDPALEIVHETSERDATLANWLVGTGVVATAAGAFLVLRSTRNRSRAPTLQIAATPRAGAVTWGGSF